ncbi:MAG TPA: hypothetical protein VG435_11770 [Acidimicrobiales bacterium]|jgi:hypothetical protein|nr:hypothetical protein [Acidimicrobiales bacterium]
MPKDRDQMTPVEDEDQAKLAPRRSAARQADQPGDGSTGRGPGSAPDPAAAEEAGADDKDKYR